MPDTIGPGGLIVKVADSEDINPVLTITTAVPGFAIIPVPTLAVSRVLSTKLVGSAVPFHRTTEVASKSDPETVSVNAGDPAITVAGASDEMRGGGAWIVKRAGSAAACPPTVTFA